MSGGGVLTAATPGIGQSYFGKARGDDVEVFTLKNRKGMTARIMTYGATLIALDTPDRAGKLDDIVLGFDSLQGYLNPTDPYFGATVGRVANRIAAGRFTLNGRKYQLATNDGPNHLHGGVRGFDKVVWTGEVVPGTEPAIKFTYVIATARRATRATAASQSLTGSPMPTSCASTISRRATAILP